MIHKSAIVIGAGIVGLAAARALSEKGYHVRVFERRPRAVGASVRNFGMIWPIGQPAGKLYDRAIRSRAIWQELLEAGGIWHRQTGSLLAAHRPEEMAVLEAFMEKDGRCSAKLLTPEQALEKSPALGSKELLGALWSEDEMIVDPREAIRLLPEVLNAQYGVEFYFGQAVSRVKHPQVWIGRQTYEADLIFVCSGQDFETLFPEEYAAAPLTKCKLQMMRTHPQAGGWNIGASLCAGLTLTHYKAFAGLPGLQKLQSLYDEWYPEHVRWGIHVLVSQNGLGEITLGDTHEYGLDLDPFDKPHLNELVLDYLFEFVQFRDMRIAETWNGVYAKTTDGSTEIVLHPEPGVVIVNGLGGAGMTLSFGLLEETADNL
jgi:FAD dependent oxidoreductase TIGR03364